jgi:hypothetical protein
MSAVPTFTDSLAAWGTDAFAAVLKRELETLRASTLPLEAGMSLDGHVEDALVVATVLSARDAPHSICARAGIFFSEVLGGCSCGDDPTSQPAYCELEVVIDKATARVSFAEQRQDGGDA